MPVGVYIASSVNSYFIENLKDVFHGNAGEHEKNQMLFLNESDFLATRVSHSLNLKGPAFTLKCGCSSSLVSVHHACNGLNNFDCDIALAGGVAIKPSLWVMDDCIQSEPISLWQKESCFPIDFKKFTGGHFYIWENVLEITSFMNNKIKKSLL